MAKTPGSKKSQRAKEHSAARKQAKQDAASQRKAKQRLRETRHVVPETEVDTDLLSDEDLQFIEQNAQFAALIAETNINALTKKQPKVKQPAYARRSVAPPSDNDDDSDLDLNGADIVPESSDEESNDSDSGLSSARKSAPSHKSKSLPNLAPESDSDDEIHQTLIEGSDVSDASGDDLDSDGSGSDLDDDSDGSGYDSVEMDVDAIPSDIESSDEEAEVELPEVVTAAELERQEARARSALKKQQKWEEASGKGKGGDASTNNTKADEEAHYEQRPRTAQSLGKVGRAMLPIKTADGRLVTREASSDEEGGTRAEDSEEEDSEDERAAAAAKRKKADAAVCAKKYADLDEAEPTMHPLERIAIVCQRIIDSPEDNISLISRVAELVKYRGPAVGGIGAEQIQAVAIASIGQVFLDVIPGYRIVELTAEQKAEKVSKDVRKLRTFEQTLLATYQKFLSALDGVVKHRVAQATKSSAIKPNEPARIAMDIFCKLLLTHPHFNFRLNVINAIVKRLTRRELMHGILETLRQVFRRDEEGSVSSETVRLIARLIKTVAYKVDPEVLRVFMHLRLKHELTLEDLMKKGKGGSSGTQHKIKKPSRKTKDQYVNKKQRKNTKFTKEVLAELKEAEAVVDLEDRKRQHKITLEHVFLTYFRILKTSPYSRVMPAALEGLGAFAHLVSIEYFDSLFRVFRLLLADPSIAYESKLSIIATANRVVSGQGEVLHLDLAEFYEAAYAVISSLRTVALPPNSPVFRMALEVVETSVLKRKCSPTIILAIFVRLLSLAASVDDPGAVLAILSLCATLFAKFPSVLRKVLDSPADRAAGVADPWTHDPHLANAAHAAPYDLTLLASHWHPDVRAAAKAVMKDMDPRNAATGRAPSRILGWRECIERWAWEGGARSVPEIATLDPANRKGKQGAAKRQQKHDKQNRRTERKHLQDEYAREQLAKPGRRQRDEDEDGGEEGKEEMPAESRQNGANGGEAFTTYERRGVSGGRGGRGGGRGRGGGGGRGERAFKKQRRN